MLQMNFLLEIKLRKGKKQKKLITNGPQYLYQLVKRSTFTAADIKRNTTSKIRNKRWREALNLQTVIHPITLETKI